MDLDQLLDVASTAIDLGDDDLAMKAVTILMSQAPDHPAVLWQVARYHGYKGAYVEAAELFRKAVAGDARLSSVAFRVGGKTLTLRDVEGSAMGALVLDEIGRGTYGLTTRAFAPGDTAIDVGAHIGAVSVVLGALHPDIRIYAYEPAASNYAMLVANLAENAVTNVVPVRAAVSGTAGTLELVWSPHQTAGATAALGVEARDQLVAEGWQRETVHCVTLEDIFTTHGIERCAFLKLDCEGAEWEIVRHSSALERVDAMALELHAPLSRQAEGVAALQQEFSALLTNRPRFPETVVSSTVWALHA